jgi:hypothetical protein
MFLGAPGASSGFYNAMAFLDVLSLWPKEMLHKQLFNL